MHGPRPPPRPAPSDVPEADRAVAVQPFAAAIAATALAVLVDTGVVGLVLGLAHRTVHADVVHLHVAAAAVVGEFHHRPAGRRGGHGVVVHAGAQGPGGDRGVVDLERDDLAAAGAARAHHDGLAAAVPGRRVAAAGADGDVAAAAALVTLGGQHHVVVVAEVEPAAGPVVEVVGDGDRAGDVAEALLRIAHAEVLVEGAVVAFDRGCVLAQAAAHVVGGAIALEAAVVHPALAAGGVVGAVAFDHVVLDQRIAGPAVERQVGVLAVVDAVVARVVDHPRPAGVPALAANPVVGAVVPLRAVAPARMQRHRGAARIFPEGVVVAVVGAGGVVVQRLRVHRAGEQAGGAQHGAGDEGATDGPGHGGSPEGVAPRRDRARTGRTGFREWSGRMPCRGGTRGGSARAVRGRSRGTTRGPPGATTDGVDRNAWSRQSLLGLPRMPAKAFHRRLIALPPARPSKPPCHGAKREPVRVSQVHRRVESTTLTRLLRGVHAVCTPHSRAPADAMDAVTDLSRRRPRQV